MALILSAIPLAVQPCRDRYDACYRWAQEQDSCKLLPKAMHDMCPVACGLCDKTTPLANPCAASQDFVGPGAIESTFRGVAARTDLQASIVSTDPLLLVLDDWLNAGSAADLAALSEEIGYGGSGSSCAFKKAGCNSASMSCLPVDGGECWAHGPMRNLEGRMLDVIGVPAANCEPLRFFRYRPGETFRLHHDAAGQGGLLPGSPGGPRVWTLYTFLQAPDAGGEFRFPALNLSIPPKAGRAILWPHVLNDDLSTPDERTAHEGAPVMEGVKIGVNLHAHRNGLRTMVLAGCAVEPHQRVSHTFNYESNPGATPLHDVIGLQATKAVPQLLAAGASANARDNKGSRPLHLAAGRGLIGAAQMLLDAGASLDAVDMYGATALHEAVFQGQVAAVRWLLEAGAAVNAAGANGTTPLLLAARHDHSASAQALVDKGAQVDLADKKQATPLLLAARLGHTEMIQVLLRSGAATHVADGNGATPLHTATAEGHVEAVRLLLEGGANVNAVGGRSGLTPLHLAALTGKPRREEAFQLLFEYGAAVDVTDARGATPRAYAVRAGDGLLVELLDHQATVAAKASRSHPWFTVVRERPLLVTLSSLLACILGGAISMRNGRWRRMEQRPPHPHGS